MTFVRIPAATHHLGWRFDDALPAVAREALEAFLPRSELESRFSQDRHVALPAFEIASAPLDVEELLEPYDDELDEVYTLVELCDLVDRALDDQGLRVPTEDELEAAYGGSLFAWGDSIPAGVPWGSETTFTGHRAPTRTGLQPNANPYKVELSRAAFKLGDGGEAVCGAYPWPMAWLSLSPSWRLAGEAVEDLLFETLEEALVRPVRR